MVNLILNVNLPYMDVLMLIRPLFFFQGRISRIFSINRLLMVERNQTTLRNLYHFSCSLARILSVSCFILGCVWYYQDLKSQDIHRLILFDFLYQFQARKVSFATSMRKYTQHSTYQLKLYTDLHWEEVLELGTI